MENSLLIISKLLLVITSLCVQSCDLFKGSDPKPKTELEKLPPITQEGKNTFGCLVNGKAFVVTNTLHMSAIYQGGGFSLSGGIYIDKKLSDIQIFVGEIMELNKSYSLINDSNKTGKFYSELKDCWFTSTADYIGKLTILSFDQTNFTISGTFEFEAFSEDCQESISITNGRFDMQYIP
jgi:hypothetical protein